MADPFKLTAVDRRIWEEELDAFVPQQIFDVHTHLYRWEFYKDPAKETGALRRLLGTALENSTWDMVEKCDRVLMPGREVHRLSFGYPFKDGCDFAAANEFVARETGKDPQSAALMLVHPETTTREAIQQIDRFGFLGFKPYRFYSRTGDAVECGITDFMPEHLIAVAHERGLLIMMHLSKKKAIGDPKNIADMVRLTEKYPNARWILAHCARSYSAWPIERAAKHLRGIPNIWYDTSSVCESDAFEALYKAFGADRVMYGSDDVPIGLLRGKYIAFGFAWAFLCETNHSLDLTSCEAQMTFTRYEQLRAMRRAALRSGLSREENEAMFHDTAWQLVQSVRNRQPVPTAASPA